MGPAQWRALAAAQLGWMLDAMDVMLYAFALTVIRDEFGLSSAAAGGLASVTLLSSAVGGMVAGVLADRVGRVRVLVWSILAYSVFTALTATAHSVAELVVWRTLLGLGLGAEWSAGSVLVAETWPARHRGKAIGIMQAGWAVGYALAAGLVALLLPRFGWRVLFVAGIAPALLTVWIRRSVAEPELWRRAAREPLAGLWSARLRGRVVFAVAMSSTVMFAYWGLFTWMPAYLATPVARGGAGLDVVRTSAWIVPVQIGAFLGYSMFGWFADRVGRKFAFRAFVIAAAVVTPLFAMAGREGVTALLVLGPLVGFFGHGYFSVFGAMLAELFPTSIRGAAQGICYNLGRAVSALAPMLIGAAADRFGVAVALSMTAAFFIAGALISVGLPETKGAELQ